MGSITIMTSPQENINSGGGNGDDLASDSLEAGQAQISTAGTDDLLDEIDGLLEANAQEFVRGYVQKGGQ